MAAAVLALTLSSAGPLGVLAQENDSPPEDDSSSGTSVLASIFSYIVIVVLVAASGLFSGLTLGLLGLDKIGLEIIAHGDEHRMAAFAKVSLKLSLYLASEWSYEVLLYYRLYGSPSQPALEPIQQQ